MKTLFIALAVIVALLAAAAGAVYYFFDANQLRPRIEAELTKVLNREVQVGDLKLALRAGSVEAADLSIAEDPAFSKKPFIQAKSLKISVDMKPLIFDHKLNVTGLSINEPDITLIQTADAVWNFSSLGAKHDSTPADQSAEKTKLDLLVKSIKIVDGKVTATADGKTRIFEKVNIDVSEFSPSSTIPFVLAAQTGTTKIKLDGRVGPINPTDTAMTPVEAKLNVAGLDLSDSGFFNKASGVDGAVTVDGQLSSSGRVVETKGTIRADKLKLSPVGKPARRTVEFDFNIHHDVRTLAGTLSRGDIRIGSAAASLTGTYAARAATPSINMKLNGPKMAISDLVEMLPPLAIVLPQGSHLEGGTAAVKVSIEGPVDHLTVEGPLALNGTRLVGFDLASKIKTVAALAGINISPNTDVQTLSAHFKRSPAGTDINALTLIAPAIGELTGAGTVSSTDDLDFKMLVKLHTQGGVMAVLGQKGDLPVPFFVRGTASSPAFVPDSKALAKEGVNSVLKSKPVQDILDKSDVGKAAKGLLDGLLGGGKKQ